MEMSAKYIIRFDSAILLSEEQTCMCCSLELNVRAFSLAQRTDSPALSEAEGTLVNVEWIAVAFSNKSKQLHQHQRLYQR